MILKPLLRIFFLEMSLQTIFEKLIRNFSMATLGDAYSGEILVGMRFSKATWTSKIDLNSEPFVFEDVLITDVVTHESGIIGMSRIYFKHFDYDLQQYVNDNGSLRFMEFFQY